MSSSREKKIEEMKKEINEVIERYAREDNNEKSKTDDHHANWMKFSDFQQNKAYYMNKLSQEDFENREFLDQQEEAEDKKWSSYFS